jgi:hypothetical protein
MIRHLIVHICNNCRKEADAVPIEEAEWPPKGWGRMEAADYCSEECMVAALDKKRDRELVRAFRGKAQ